MTKPAPISTQCQRGRRAAAASSVSSFCRTVRRRTMGDATCWRSIARFGWVCAALCGIARVAAAQEAERAAAPDRLSQVTAPAPYGAWQGNSPHPPPPAIVLRPPPPPELAPPEYARRPVELVPEFSLGLPSCSDGSRNDARCEGLGAGLGFGASA